MQETGRRSFQAPQLYEDVQDQLRHEATDLTVSPPPD